MVIIAKISKGSKMDQIYIPKNRAGLGVGSYVLIRPVEPSEQEGDTIEKPYFYNTGFIGNVKLGIVKEIFDFIDREVGECQNVIITGSFVDAGFRFNDIDVLIVTSDEINEGEVAGKLTKKVGAMVHVVAIGNKSLIEGLATDPIYQMMLSKCISRKRFVYSTKRRINYKLLDLHLLKSKMLVDNFDALDGNEKYDLTRNMISIYLFILNKKVERGIVDSEIIKIFGLKDTEEIKRNMVDREDFLKKYNKIYKQCFDKIMGGLRNDTKQG